jgi:hypothetical protein
MDSNRRNPTDAEAFQRLSPGERLRALFEFIAAESRRISPSDREATRQRKEADHEEFKRHLKQLIAENEARVHRMGIEAPNI